MSMRALSVGMGVAALAGMLGLWIVKDGASIKARYVAPPNTVAPLAEVSTRDGALARAAALFAKPQEWRPRQSPFYMLLTVEGLQYCPEAQVHAADKNPHDQQAFCRQNGHTNAAALQQLLDTVEPGGAAGKVQVGYVITLQLLSAFVEQSPGQWTLDKNLLRQYLQLVEQVDRPVALYLSSTHFDSLGPLPNALKKDPRNLALFADLEPRELSYFGYPIIPYTLNPDADLPVNRYKRQAMREIAEMVRAMPEAAQKKIVAIFLGGEMHHFYANFEAGTGEFERTHVTDYSPASVAQFRQRSLRAYGGIARANQRWGSTFASFDDVHPPYRNRRDEADIAFWQHYDGYSHGELVVGGWFYDAKGDDHQFRVYINGELAGDAAYGLNRLDVYRAVEAVQTPSVGLRLDVDFSQWRPGSHDVAVTYARGGRECLLGRRTVHVLGADPATGRPQRAGQAAPQTALDEARLHCTPEFQAGKQFWLDSPADALELVYNPLARDWNQFRQEQVAAYMHALYYWALEAGYAPGQIFSHQILPQLNSTWNVNLFATQQSLDAKLPWKSGFNLYGGGVWSPWTKAFIERVSQGEASYGIPEYHPQQWKSKPALQQALLEHYQAGAHFISPYYFTVAPPQFLQDAQSGSISKMRIEPGNTAEGSNLFYEALLEFAQH